MWKKFKCIANLNFLFLINFFVHKNNFERKRMKKMCCSTQFKIFYFIAINLIALTELQEDINMCINVAQIAERNLFKFPKLTTFEILKVLK